MKKFKAGVFYRRIKEPDSALTSVKVTVGKIYKALPETTSTRLSYKNDEGKFDVSSIEYIDNWEEINPDNYQIY